MMMTDVYDFGIMLITVKVVLNAVPGTAVVSRRRH